MFYSIIEVCKKSEVSSRTLRVWEEARLVESTRNEKGVRLFSGEIFERIERIQMLKEFGLSLADISSILSGKKPEALRELLQQRREEIERETLHLGKARRKLAQVEELLGDGASDAANSYSELLAPPEQAKGKALEALLQQNGLQHSEAHRRYLQQEFALLSPDRVLARLAAFKRVARYAQEHNVPLCFVRGVASASLALRLCGWNTSDPVAENLVPRHIISPNLEFHLDVPYSGSEHFFNFLRGVNAELDDLKIVAYQLPALDIIRDFSDHTGHDVMPFVTEEKIVEHLRSGDCEKVYGIDESGDTLFERLYRESSLEHRSIPSVSSELRQFSPKSRDDVFRFLALRPEKTHELFLSYVAGKCFERWQESKLAQALPPENRGYLIFHEELIAAMQSVTGWSLPRVCKMRVSAGRRELSELERQEFIDATDPESFELLQFWSEKTFCKSHMVGWWSALAATASCKLRNSKEWSAAIKRWEEKHQLAWNNFGVIHRHARLFTPS